MNIYKQNRERSKAWCRNADISNRIILHFIERELIFMYHAVSASGTVQGMNEIQAYREVLESRNFQLFGGYYESR